MDLTNGPETSGWGPIGTIKHPAPHSPHTRAYKRQARWEENAAEPGSSQGATDAIDMDWQHELPTTPLTLADSYPNASVDVRGASIGDTGSSEVPLPAIVPDEAAQGTEDTVICYGAICNIAAMVLKKPQKPPKTPKFITMETFAKAQSFYFACPGTPDFAVLDYLTSERLQALARLGSVRSVVVMETSHLANTKAKSKIVLSINVIGPQGLADRVGDVLDKSSITLQHPYYLDRGVEYINPHFYSPSGPTVMTHLVGMDEAQLRAKQLSDDVEELMDSLGATDEDGNEELEGRRLRGSLFVDLTGTQVSALRFMSLRENETKCVDIHDNLRELTGASSKTPSLSMGGILADSMGLGKTLTALSLIITTLSTASKFQAELSGQGHDGSSGDVSSATLVLVPSMQVLDVWLAEIKCRLRPGTLRVEVFHGSNRKKTPSLLRADIVLTTYETLARDAQSSHILSDTVWFRIILDEAHWIRNMTSKRFRACENSRSLRRWCLTGTPIQNRLEDLASLVRFLGIQPFSTVSVFRKVILDPLSDDSSDRCRNLRILLRAICLRRDAKKLNVPEPVYKTETVKLSPDEREGYAAILKNNRQDLERTVSQGGPKREKYNVLFMVMLSLRRYCNTGTHRVKSSAARDDCGSCDADAIANLEGRDNCPDCGRLLNSPKSHSPLSTARGSSSGLCTPPAPYLFVSSPSPMDLSTPSPSPQLGGFSSKLTRLVENIRAVGSSDKSIVFSFWTSTLDVLQELLETAGVSSVRIDGTVPHTERMGRLEAFRSSQDVPVLMMTMGTGAVGLNLTAANYVHLVEPQWNPSVEEQAIARAVRMGQTRTVTVIRYVTESSVEENIVHLQKNKQHLAKFTLNGTDEMAAGKLDDLKFIIDFDAIV